jgi:hypothetical protein
LGGNLRNRLAASDDADLQLVELGDATLSSSFAMSLLGLVKQQHGLVRFGLLLLDCLKQHCFPPLGRLLELLELDSLCLLLRQQSRALLLQLALLVGVAAVQLVLLDDLRTFCAEDLKP